MRLKACKLSLGPSFFQRVAELLWQYKVVTALVTFAMPQAHESGKFLGRGPH